MVNTFRSPNVTGYEVIRNGQTMSVRDLQPGDIIKREVTPGGGGGNTPGYFSPEDKTSGESPYNPQNMVTIREGVKPEAEVYPQPKQQIYPSTVTPAKPQGIIQRIKSIPGYLRTNVQQDVPGTVVGTGQIIVAGAKESAQIETQKQTERGTQDLRAGTADIQIKRPLKPYEARGTISQDFATFQARPFSEEEIISQATFGAVTPAAATNYFKERLEKETAQKIEAEFKTYTQPRIEAIEKEAQVELNRAYYEIAARTDLSVEQKNQLLTKRSEEINQAANIKAQQLTVDFQATTGAQIEKESDQRFRAFQQKLNIQRNIKSGVTAAAVGAVAGPAAAALIPARAAGTAATVAKVGGVAVTAVTGAQIGSGIYQDYKQGDVTALSLTSRISQAIPLVTFYAGAKVSTRILNPKVDAGQLKTATETAQVRIKSETGITKEANLAKLDMTEEGKLYAKQQLQAGYSIRKVTYEIYNENAFLNKVIKKAFPTRDISFIEITNAEGRVINSFAVGRLSLGGGRYVYTEDVLQQRVGIRDSSGNIRAETNTVSVTDGKVKAVKSFELIKPRVEYVQGPEGRIEGRVIETKTASMTMEKGRPARIARTAEYQKIVAEETTAINLNIEQGGITKQYPFIEKDITFKTESAAGYSKRILDGLDIKKVSKPYTSPTQSGQALKQVQVTEQIVIPKTDFSEQVTASLKNADIKTKKIKGGDLIKPVAIEEVAIEKLKIPKYNTQVFDVALKQAEREPLKFRPPEPVVIEPAKIKETVTTNILQPQIIKQRQPQKQALKIPEPPMLIPANMFRAPKIIIAPIKFPGRTELPAGFQRPPKRPKKIRIPSETGYSASLISAAVQRKPFKVTEAQYKKLKKKQYSGIETRPVLEIVPDKELEKQIKRAVKFD